MMASIVKQAKLEQLYVESVRMLTGLRSFAPLCWWEWGKILGAIGLVSLAVLILVGVEPHLIVVAFVLHFAIDFTFQSPETALRKVERGRHLTVHAVVAGGLPLAIAGLLTQNPVTVLTWTAIGIVSHYAVDWTRRFGLRQMTLAVVADQACHLLTILLVILMI